MTIASDLSRNLYSDAYINFLYSIPRPAMEEFASQVASDGTSESIAQLYDQYLNFVVAEPDLFSLAMGRETYWTLNSATTPDDKVDELIDKVVVGLFSVAVTMGRS
jgi:sec1 family domain-containing protein 1